MLWYPQGSRTEGGHSREGKQAHLPNIVDPVEVGCDLGVYSRGTRPPTAIAPAHDAHCLPPARVIHQRPTTVTLWEARAGAAGEGGQKCGGGGRFSSLPSLHRPIVPCSPSLSAALPSLLCLCCSCRLEHPSLLGPKGSACG